MEHKLPQIFYAIITITSLVLLLFIRVAFGQSEANNVFLPTVLNDSSPSIPTDNPIKTPTTTPIATDKPSTPTPTDTATLVPTAPSTPTATQTMTPDALATLKAQLTGIAETQTAEAPTPTPTVPTPTLTPCSNGMAKTGLTTVQFARPSYSVLENAGNAVISVTLASPATQAVTVHYATANDTAIAGGDYVSSNSGLTFNPGQTVKTFIVPILNDSIIESNESISLTLVSPVCAKLGVPTTATLTIIDDDVTRQQIAARQAQ